MPRADVARASDQRRLESRVVGHVVGLVGDRDFVIPTTLGPKPAVTFQSRLIRWNMAVQVKHALVDADVSDFELQDAMPLGAGHDLSLGRQVLLAFRQPVAHMRFASLPVWDDLVRGREPTPLTSEDIRRRVGELPVPGDERTPTDQFGGPMTLVLFAPGGFTEEARRTAREFIDGPPTILIEPNVAGGFTVSGPPAAAKLKALLDPEAPEERFHRVAHELDRRRLDLLTGSVSLDVVAERLHLQPHHVAEAAGAWARKTGEPLRVGVLNGVNMLYRDESVRPADPHVAATGAGAAEERGTLTAVDRLRKLFGGRVSPEARLAELAGLRASLTHQRDKQYDEMAVLEAREQDLRDEFAAAQSEHAKRRVTSQLLQIRSDLTHRRTTLGLLNQQLNVIVTQINNLELARTGRSSGRLPGAEELADDAARAEQVLADLEVSSETAARLAGDRAGTSGMTRDEAELYEELERTTARPTPTVPDFDREVPATPAKPRAEADVPPAAEAEVMFDADEPPEPEAVRVSRRRAEAD